MSKRATGLLLAALLAAGTLIAAKPVPPVGGPGDAAAEARERSRGRGISLCVAELRAIPDLSPDDLESICGCAIDRYIERLGATLAAPRERDRFPGDLRSQLTACTARARPDRVSDVARLNMPPSQNPSPAPVTVAPPADDPKPLDDDAVPADATTGGESSGGGFWAWLSNLGWPAWLSGASVLWWVAIGIFVLGLLILKFRARDPRNDLSAPPSSMRRGAPPQPPRRPDLPR